MPYEAIGGLRPLRTALDDWIKGPDARGAPDAQTRAVFPISPYRLDANIDLRELNHCGIRKLSSGIPGSHVEVTSGLLFEVEGS